jgi:hypothetical protein
MMRCVASVMTLSAIVMHLSLIAGWSQEFTITNLTLDQGDDTLSSSGQISPDGTRIRVSGFPDTWSGEGFDPETLGFKGIFRFPHRCNFNRDREFERRGLCATSRSS